MGNTQSNYQMMQNPTIHPPRKVPLTILPKLKETLDRLEMAGVVSNLDHPTEWLNSLVIVEKKDGSLRLYLDPKDLKKFHVNCTTKNILLLLICEIVNGTLY